jgi:general secretion pathway protein G
MLIERHLMSNLRKSFSAARNDEGFTLIELLIVIVVLGILASIVVFGVSTFRSDAQTAACRADLKTVSVAADAFNAKNGAYPATADNLQKLVDDGYLKAKPAAASAVSLSNAGVVSSTACTL